MPSNPEWNLLKTEIIEPNQLEFIPTAEKGRRISNIALSPGPGLYTNIGSYCIVIMILVIFLLTKMLDKDLISVETGRYVNVQSMIFKFVYERSPLFTEQVLVIPIILVFFGEFINSTILIDVVADLDEYMCTLRVIGTAIYGF